MISTEWLSDATGHDNLKDIFNIPGFDSDAAYLILYDGKIPAGIGALRIFQDGIEIFNLKILSEFKNQGFEDFILRLLIRKGFDMGYEKQYASIPDESGEFFKKLGFCQEDNLMIRFGDVGGGCA